MHSVPHFFHRSKAVIGRDICLRSSVLALPSQMPSPCFHSFTVKEVMYGCISTEGTPSLILLFPWFTAKFSQIFTEATHLKLLQFYNDSWANDIASDISKLSRVIPILKPVKISLCLSSYRPNALASCVGKLIEKMILFCIERFLEKIHFDFDIMSGFCQGRSSIDGAIYLVTSIPPLQIRRRISGAEFLDINRALDSIIL